MEQLIQQAVEALRLGKTLLYPTDTLWGLGCDARNAEAVERLYALKERDRTKSMLILCVEEQVENGEWRTESGERSMGSGGRPTTYILPREVWQRALKVEVAPSLPAADGSLGIRIPRHAFCQEVIRRLGGALVSTSANLSGHPSPTCYEEIGDELKQRVDFCVPPLAEFLTGETRASRIVKLETDGTTTVLRP